MLTLDSEVGDLQVWRPLKGPVKASPLGMIDASTVQSSDLTPYQINFPGRTGYNFAVHSNPSHRQGFFFLISETALYLFWLVYPRASLSVVEPLCRSYSLW